MKNFAFLIIDDDEDDRYILKRRLKKIYSTTTVFECTNGLDGIDFFKNHNENTLKYPETYPPLITFLDINMPLMNGFQFLEEFTNLQKDNSLFSSCIVVMFSSSEDKNEIQNLRQFPSVKDYIVKSTFSEEDIKNVVDTYLNR